MSLLRLAAKYSLSGALNTLVGYALIFGLMAFGCGPSLSNAMGYAAGFVLSFLQSRYWVFRSTDTVARDASRFVPAFFIAYGANIAVLQLALAAGVNPYLAQLASGCAFIGAGFVLNHLFVFRQRHD
jgi:putative flippase GtrA